MNKTYRPGINLLLIVLSLFLTTTSALAQTLAHTGGTIYVRPTAFGNGSGSSWGDATADLQGAINTTGVTKVFVAIGNYDVPLPNSFAMKKDVAIYGGFDPANGITDLSHHRILPNELSEGAGEGSVLNGQNTVTVVDNSNLILTSGATAILDGFTIKNGYADYGGGILNGTNLNDGMAVVFRNLVVKNNTATVNGGGIRSVAGIGNYTNVIVKNNTAAYGGGIYMANSPNNSLTNVLVVNNTATVQAGGVAVDGALLTNVTIANNTSPNSTTGNGITSVGMSAPYLRNCIVYGGYPFLPSTKTQYSLIEGNSNTSYGNLNATGITLADIFTDPANGDYTLKSTSPAVNAGNNTLFAGLDGSTADVAGNPRLFGSVIDMGADEYQGNPSVLYVKETATGIGSGTSWDNATADLQGAIDAPGVQQVWVAVGNYDAPAGSFSMRSGVAIYGGFDPDNGITDLSHARILANHGTAEGSVLNGNNERRVVFNNLLGDNAILDGFTIANGYTTERGGGIYNYSASPVLRNLLIINNKAEQSGGGIANYESEPLVINARITGNIAHDAAGIYSYNCGYTDFINVSVTDNHTTYVNSTITSSVSYLNFTNLTLAGNIQGIQALYVAGGSVRLSNSVVFGGVGTYGAFNVDHSFIEGSTATDNGNLDATGYMLTDVFTDPAGGDYSLRKSSPVIDAGSNALYDDLIAGTKDIAGNDRVFDASGGGRIDMGAFESPHAGVVPDANGTIYVRLTESGNGSGSDWDNAIGSLRRAILVAGAQQLFVEAGTYYVGEHSFIMRNGLAIYGGFDPDNGIRDLSDARILPDASQPNRGSILHGQITRPVFWNVFQYEAPLNRTAVLDGFLITAGKHAEGGGMYNMHASPTLRNLVIMSNSASSAGAGMYNQFSSPLLINTVISNNTVLDVNPGATNAYGGGIYNRDDSEPVLINVTVAGNGLRVLDGSLTMKGAGMYSIDSSPKVYNSIFWNNHKSFNTTVAGADFEREGYGTLTLKNSTTQSYNTGSGADNNKVGVDPLFVNTGNRSYGLQPGSPAIDAGNNDLRAGLDASTQDLAGNSRLEGSAIDMGAYEFAFRPEPTGVIYVKPVATGLGDGSSWENATGNLHQAIHAEGVQKVFVAVGNYPVGAQSFSMKDGVEIYGGFDPLEDIRTLDDQRILPTLTEGGSVLNGANTRRVIENFGLTSTAVLDGFTIMNGNETTLYGGGISNVFSLPVYRNLVIRNNSAVRGGGIYMNVNSSPTFVNCIIADNSADTQGGGIYNTASSPSFINALITGNSALEGGGLYNQTGGGIYTNVTMANNGDDGFHSPGSSAWYNSIIWDQISIGNFAPYHSLIKDRNNTSDGNIDATGISADQVFTDPGAGDYTLKSTSPAIDKGDNTLFADLDGDTRDLVGNPRVHSYANGGTIDLGAYESPYTMLSPTLGIVYVRETATGNEDGSGWDHATADLQRAINTSGVTKVFVATGNYNVGSSSFVMKNGVEIYGGFDPDQGIDELSDERILPNETAFEGSVLNGKNERPVVWNFDNALNNTAVLDGFTLKNGSSANGGAMYNGGSSPTLSNLWIKANTATADGGAIYNVNSSSPVMTNITIEGNTANYGGGIFNRNSSSPVMTNVIIKNNTANNDGGAMYNDVSASPVMTNMSITENTAQNGAGMYNRTNSAPVLVNALIADNTANTNGGAIRNQSTSSPSLTNVTIENNNGSNAIYATDGNTTLNNSIVFGTVSASYTAQNSLIEGNAGGSNGNLDGTSILADAVFSNASAGDYTLKSTSPVIDKGNHTLNATARDLLGNPRIMGTGIDLGAYEQVIIGPGAGGIIYVRETATGTGSGSDWANAMDDLHNAIHIAGVSKVFVAVGEYRVGANSFVMKNDVEIYGGFDPENGITDLSHDRILPNHGVSEGSVLNGENVRPVIWNVSAFALPLNNSAVLDGFTLKNGFGDAAIGGAIHNYFSSPTLRNLVIKNNKGGQGGGIRNENSSPLITNAILKNNEAFLGGGLYIEQHSNAVFTNVIITDNTSTYNEGGGVYFHGSTIKFFNSTIAGNSPNAIRRSNNNGSSNIIYFYNSIVYGDITGYNSPVIGQYSLIENRTDISNGNIDATGITPESIFADPSAGDYSLKENSPAIDAGDENFYEELDEHTKDLAGNPRVYVYNGGVIDLGAYESSYNAFPYIALTPDANGIIYVKETATGDKSGSSWANATDNLKRAVRIAGAQQVWAAIGTYPAYNIALRNGVAVYGGFDPDNGIVDLTSTRILPDSGTGTEGSVINAQNRGAVISNNNNSLDNTAILDGFTLTNGSNATGGGIYNDGASPTLSNLWIKGNTATNDGGGMYNVNSSSPVMTNVTVSGNTARYAGGVFNRNSSSPVMTNVRISSNTAAEDGGGMYNDASASPVMTNVSITGNAAKNGAGMYNRTNSSPSLTNVSIAGNNGSTALYTTGAGATTLANSIVYGSVSGNFTAQYSLVQGNAGGTNGNLDGTSILADAVFSNAPGGNYTLKATSPVIDKGNNALNASLLDLAGNARITDAVIDLGAYEFQPVILVPDGQGIVYVNQQVAGGSAEGTDWANAVPELADALRAAQTNTAIQQIWVAKGTYLPKYKPVTTDSEGNPTSDQDKTFLLVKDVKIYGGFDPENGLVDMDGRDPLAAPTVLSGDLGAPGTETDNAYHVVLSVGDAGAAELNGFTVLGGYAFGGAATLSIHSKNIPRYQGAGLFLVESSPVIAGIHVRNNMAMVAGAGMYLSYSNSALTNVRISGNTTFGNGGGMFNGNSSPVLTNVLIDNNSASGRGGGMENGVSSPVLTNVTIAYNRTGGGMVNSSGSSPLIRNSILYGNASYNVWNADIGVSQPVFSYSLLQGSGGSDAWDSSGGNVDGGNNIDLDPLFVDAENVLVANRDYRLQTGSPAQEAGDNSLYYMGGTPDLFGITTDLDGNPRVSGDFIDLGAYEFVQSPPVVITPDANDIVYVRTLAVGAKDGSTWEDATADLQGAIQSGASQVYVAAGTYNVPVAINGFVMKNGVAIYGGFDPDNGVRVMGDVRILPSPALLQGSVLHGLDTKSVIRNEFTVADALDHTAVLDGFTLTKGRAVDGGGIYNEYASPTLRNLLISDNRATRHGGGMYNSYSSPVMDRMTVQGNTADNQGGGIYTGRATDFNLSNILFKGNTAEQGGGIYHFDTEAVLTNVAITGNTATGTGTGSAFHAYSGSNRLINVTIAGNTGHAFHNEANAFLDNTILYGGTDGLGYIAMNSLIEGSTNTANGNLDATGLGLSDIFKDPAAGDYTLSLSSGAVNAGSNTLFPSLDGTTKDLAANPRLFGAAIDLGAYELQEQPVVIITPDGNGIVYVRPVVSGTGKGNDWANATADLQGAISSGATSVFVAIGQHPAPLAASFAMKNGVAIYGGFDPEHGIEDLDDERILPNRAFPSVGGGAEGSVLMAQNGYPAINNSSLSSTAVLDGFTITGGTDAEYGGGIANNSASPVLKNLVIRDNHVQFDGGAIYNYASSPALTNVIISGNSAMFGGAMSNWDGSDPVLINVVLSGNTASLEGGAIYNFMSSPQLINTVIAGNDAPDGSALHNNFGTTSQILNSIIYGNTGGAVIVNTDPSADIPVYKHSLVEGSGGSSAWESAFGIDGGNNIAIAPQFTDPDAGNYTLQMGSPAINAGDHTLFPDLDGNTKDLGGNPRLSGVAIDMGAYEAQGQAQTIDPISDMVREYGDADYEPGATASSGLPVSYHSADNTIAEAYQDAADGNKWKITIKKTGTVTITASQSGGGSYLAAPDVVFDLTVNKRAIQVSFTNDQVSKVYDGNVDGNITVAHLQFGAGNVLSGDDLEIVLNADAIVFDDQNVGTDKLITLPLASIGLAGADLENYILGNTANLTAAIGAISPADLTVTVDAGQGKVYGDAEPPLTYLVAGFLGTDDDNILTGSLERAAGEDVGIYTIGQGSLDAGDNYTIVFVGEDFEVTKVVITGITFDDGNFVYDGTEKTLAIAGTLPAGASVSYTIDGDAGNGATDVGNYDLVATITGGTNYNDLVLNAELEITKATITGITFDDGSFVYDGTEKTLAIVGTLPAGTSVSYTIDGDAGNGATDVGTYHLTATITGGANYNDLVLNAELEITITKSDITGITFVDGSFGYDGTEKHLEISGTLPAGTSVSYVNNGRTELGSQTVTANISGGVNYNDLTLFADLTIVKGTIADVTFDDASFVYDGTEKTLEITGTLPAGASVSYTIDGASGNGATDVGTYDLVATITGGTNYNDLVLNAELEITKATITGITFTDGSFVYDGTEKTLAIAGTLPAGANVCYTIDGAAGIGATDVGTYDLVATIDGGLNYNDLILIAELEITKATITGITFTDGSFVYDGTEKTLAITGTLPTGASVSYTIDGSTGNEATDVGTYDLVATITGGTNYNDLVLNAELEITKADITGITFTDGSFEYDGTEKTLAITGTLPTGASVSYTNNGRTDVGSQTVTATINGGTNYNDLILHAELEIIKANIIGVTFTDGSFVYDGTEKTLAIAGTLPVGANVSYIIDGNAGNGATDVGTYNLVATIVGGTNYNDLVLNAELEITKATITGITFTDGSFVYDGTEKTLAIASTLPIGASVSYTNNGRTDVGSQTVTATIDGGPNYHDLVLDAELEITITKSEITGVTFTNSSFGYDGTEKTLAITGTLPVGTIVSYINNGRTELGSQTVTANISGGVNYNDLTLFADLTIVKGTIAGVTFDDASFVYDGTEKTLAIDGTLPTGASVSYTIDGAAGNGATDVGTYDLVATISGGVNYNDLVLNAELEITKATITGIAFTDESFVYDGAEKTLAITGTLPTGASVSYTIDGASGNGATDVGTYSVVATITGGTNYNDLVLNVELGITKANITGVTFTDGSFVYEGTEKTLTIAGTLPAGVSVSYTIDGNAGNGATDVGTYHLTATITGGANYNDLVLNAELVITKATITGVTFTDGSFIYDGTEKTLTIAGTLPAGVDAGADVHYTIDGAAGNGATDVGTYHLTATIAGGTNYNDLVLNAELEITKADITGVTFTDGSFVYDGTERTLEITGTLPTGASVSYTIDGNTGNGATDIGTYLLTATITGGTNYNDLVLNASLEITSTKSDITGITFTNGSFGYDGTQKTLAITGTLPAGASVSYTNNGRTELGSQTVTAMITGGTNYNDLTLFADLTIVKGTITGITFTDGSFVYDGTEKSLTITGTLPSGTSVSYTIDGNTGNGATDVGTYHLTATITGNNYQTLVLSATLTVTSQERTLTFPTLPAKMFGDPAFAAGASASTGEPVVYSSSNPAVAEVIDGLIHVRGAGTTTITVTLPVNSNYTNNPVLSQQFIVSKAPQTITHSMPSQVNRNIGQISLNATSSSGLPVTYEVDDAQIATIEGEVLHILRLGTIRITARQAGDANYHAATPVTIVIEVLDLTTNQQILIHQALSPNGDGINDVLTIEGIRNYTQNKVTIFNRNGTIVYEASGYNNTSVVFSGRDRNQRILPNGTYFYIVEIKDGSNWKVYKGYIVLKN